MISQVSKVHVSFYFKDMLYAGRSADNTPIPHVGDTVVIKEKIGKVVDVTYNYTCGVDFESVHIAVFAE